MAGLLVVMAAFPARPQGNIDAGKTPAQLFSDICTNCHRRPQELKRGASASFLRQHYMPGSQEAAAMAAYLASIPNDPRGRGRDKAAKAPPPQHTGEKSKSHPKGGRRPAEVAKAPAPPPPPVEAPTEPSEPPAAQPPAPPEPETPPTPSLQPFEE